MTSQKVLFLMSGITLGCATGLYIFDQPIRRAIEDVLKSRDLVPDLPASVVSGSKRIDLLKTDPRPAPPPLPPPKQTKYTIFKDPSSPSNPSSPPPPSA
ncbi:hypothetical protein [Phaffia rhodozyma]|uniref:Uncharacterized protein n=1 Tax=Phaffia rhodozyma TaxID=264483 RepID=A0A0F7SXA0_PHARH|nr:hypothetical protein [Phaffia rhodozyma]